MRAAKKAKIIRELKKLGLNNSDFAHESWCPEGIALCTEGDNAHLVGDYYLAGYGGAGYDDFGVADCLNKILEKNGSHCEWYNSAVLCVYN